MVRGAVLQVALACGKRARWLAFAIAFLLMLPVGGAEASQDAAAIDSIEHLATWLTVRREAAQRHADELQPAIEARIAAQALATARIAAALQQNAALLAARRSLGADADRARAAQAAALETARRLGRPVAAGLMALAKHGREEERSPRALAHLRAVVGSMAAPYADSVRQQAVLDGDAARLAGRERELDDRLGTVATQLARLDAELRFARAGVLAATRERDEAIRRRDALGQRLAELALRERLAGGGLDNGARAATMPRRAPDLLAALAAEPGAFELLASARMSLPAVGTVALTALDRRADPAPRASPTEPFVAPIAGRAVAPVGADEVLYRRGRLIETTVSQTVSAPCDGEVVFAEAFKGFGLLLIIARGDGYHVLLSGFSHLAVGRGAKVVAGQAVGGIDAEGGPARLYLELRYRGSPVDPAAWLASREDRVRS